ncbi:MAG: hypothetical protein K2R98_23240 [Gemmataceae bacterium]|nr:hypothetical protein [Gemmataceae bacterium]
MLAPGQAPPDEGGELLSCAYTPDGAFVLSGGWDGCLRLWESAFGSHVTAFRVSDKPVGACAVSADGKTLVSGSLDGMIGMWDALTHQPKFKFLAHTRPISAILFGSDGQSLATASWDGTIMLWKAIRERDGRVLSGHKDIVSGCAFTPDGQLLVSWSHDHMVRVWDVASARQRMELPGHADRLHAGGVSPDGHWVASASRDGALKLWDIQGGRGSVASVTVHGTPCACLFLLDGESLAIVTDLGHVTLHSLPDLEQHQDLSVGEAIHCAELAPTGGQIALGCNDGRVRFVGIEGFDTLPLCVTAKQTTQRTQTTVQKLFGRSQLVFKYQSMCPVCRHTFELPEGKAGQTAACPNCRRKLRVGAVARQTRDV